MAGTNTVQMRDAVAWATDKEAKAHEPSSNPIVWLWEAIQGDFNETRSTSQILVDAGISMIPLVDQVCDIRDLAADCRKLKHDLTDLWAWVALALTLIGLFPTLGSLVKGVLKIFFGFVRRTGGHKVVEAVEAAMTWLISFLRRSEVQKYLRLHNVDEVFKWLATELKDFRAQIRASELTAAFDRAVNVLAGLVEKVELVPMLGAKARQVLAEVKEIRLAADAHLARALQPVQDVVDTIIRRLEKESIEKYKGIVDVRNIHYRGVLPESAAVALMKKRKPAWLTQQGVPIHPGIDPSDVRAEITAKSARKTPTGTRRDHKDIFPPLTDENIASFHTLRSDTIHGPARLYRILAPSSRGMSDCWVSEEVFKKLQSDPDPKAAWRKFLAVWPDWNGDGQFVIYDVRKGESLNVWRGIAASQTRKDLPGSQLEGGFEQIVFNVSKKDNRNDSVLYYQVIGDTNPRLGKALTQEEVNAATATMSRSEKKVFFDSRLAIREEINHPNISGPFETGWGYTEFDGAGMSSRIGLPELPGQLTTIR
jgi:hypothetical protein